MIKIARETLTQRMYDLWVDSPVAWQNSTPFSGSDPWVRFSFFSGAVEKTSVGNDVNHYRLTGQVVVQVFVPEGSGDGESDRLKWAVVDVFRGFRSGGLSCLDPEFQTVGAFDGWFQVNVKIPFTAQGAI